MGSLGSANRLPCTDGLEPRYTGLYPDGNRPEAPESPLSFTGTPSQLSLITVTTDGTYNFGSRTNQKTKVFSAGNRYWIDGVEQSLAEASMADNELIGTGQAIQSSAFRVCDGAIARGADKAGRGGFAYESRSDSQFIGQPYGVNAASSPDARTTAKLFFSCATRHMGALKSMRLASYGAFTNDTSLIPSDTSTFAYGEQITGTKSGGGAFTGRLIAIDTVNKVLMFTVDGSYNSTDNFNGTTGATFTGATSGGSVTMDGSVYTIPNANKPIRASTNNSSFPSVAGVVGLDFITTSAGQFALKLRENPNVLEDYRSNGNISPDSNQWETWRYYVDYSGAEFITKTYRDSAFAAVTHPNTQAFDLSEIDKQMAVILFGYDWGGSTNPNLIRARVKDVVLDYDLAGAFIANAATHTSATIFASCGVDSWSTASASIRLNYGQIPEGQQAYLYLTNSTGEVINLSGLSLGEAPAWA